MSTVPNRRRIIPFVILGINICIMMWRILGSTTHPAASADVLAILSGHDPQIAAHFFTKLSEGAQATGAEGSLRLLVWNDPSIRGKPDLDYKKEAIFAPRLLTGAALLQNAGADYIVLPSLVTGLLANDLRAALDVPVLTPLDAGIAALRKELPGGKKIAVLGGKRLLASQILQIAVAKAGYDVYVPSDEQAERAMKSPEAAQAVIAELEQTGIDGVLIADTRHNIGFNPSESKIPVVFLLQALMKECTKLISTSETQAPER